MWFSHQTGWKMRYLRLVISAMLVTLTQLLPANASAIETLQKRKVCCPFYLGNMRRAICSERQRQVLLKSFPI
ncbi:hypothetical protein I7I50_08207 [Histoplasma capsulatum G186AR]|uniref:Secreted protein n=1 Tax=Ajellomyces capsulatus TaxID=5037 RepID=A0A8H7YN73_AJECA|nr:hypothetical protein I7I52_05724 [Histoplasma capsulatum]QSS73430.1 hypothetical protein I7I50_08207 [Histoplasma capsulatum G186AR]